MRRSLAPEAGLLDPAKRRDFGGDQPGVEADHAVLQGLWHPPRTVDIAGIDIGGEARIGVIGHGDGLVLGGEADQPRDRPKSLLAAQ